MPVHILASIFDSIVHTDEGILENKDAYLKDIFIFFN